MKPGPELDALIDEKVMGHPQCKQNHAQSAGWCLSCGPAMTRANGFWPRYSTEMEGWHGGAWDVVERMNSYPGAPQVVTLECRISCSTHPFYYLCRFGNGITAPVEHALIHEAWGLTMPEAICLAALKALGVPA